MSFLNPRSSQASQENKSCIVITGAESGIGLELSKIFLSQGHIVVGVGKNKDKLDAAMTQCPQLVTILCDIGIEKDRVALVEKLSKDFPQVNVLINNAAVNRFPPSLTEVSDEDWKVFQEELNTDLTAPMHLSTLFVPFLKQKQNAMIVNVTCETAFVPVAKEPIYSVAKAGLHALTLVLRFQLKDASVHVVEMIPPLVDTDMLPSQWKHKAIKADLFAQSAVEQLEQGALEIGYHNEKIFRGDRDTLDGLFREWNHA